MRKNTPAKPSRAKNANHLILFSMFNITRHTRTYWVLLGAVSSGLLAFELGGWHQRLGLPNAAFWQNVITPFCNELDLNFINLYISQISTTFLVTSFLSFLGGKEDPIYWTSAMEYKLINPKGTSLRDITWYCLGTLITSLVAVFFRAALMFLFSFGINLLGLSIITCRMILAFFARAEIKRQLQQDFLKASNSEKHEMFQKMEEYIVRAAHNHDVGYLRECVDFFRYLEEQKTLNFPTTHFERLRWFFQIIPDQLNEVRWSIFVRLAKLLAIGDSISENKHPRSKKTSREENSFPALETLQLQHDQIQKELESKTQLLAALKQKVQIGRVKNNIEQLEQEIILLNQKKRELTITERAYHRADSPEKDNRRKLQDDVLRMLHNNIQTRVLTARDAARWCDAAVTLSQKNITELFLFALAKNASQLNFHRDFKEFIYLLKEAYDGRSLLDDYMFMLHRLHHVVEHGISNLDNKTGKKCVAHCYDWKDTALIFQCICDENALIERDRADFLLRVLQYSPELTNQQKTQLLKLVRSSSQLAASNSAKPLLAKLACTN